MTQPRLKQLVLATRNEDKVKEIKEILQDLNLEILTLNHFGNVPEVKEDGRTLHENAQKKAEIIGKFLELPTIADDTGLEVDYLRGAPGVFSSRFAGENATYSDNVKKLLSLLKEVPWEKRTARFRCVMAFYDTVTTHFIEGVCEGYITEKPQGDQGFGYDPVFFVPEYQCTFAEMDLKQKNQISHRGKALKNLKNFLIANKYID